MGGHGDLARVALAEGTPEPARPSQLYDWDLATAALAAAHAVARELKAAAFPPPPSFQPQPQPQPAPAPPLQHPGARPPPRKTPQMFSAASKAFPDVYYVEDFSSSSLACTAAPSWLQTFLTILCTAQPLGEAQLTCRLACGQMDACT